MPGMIKAKGSARIRKQKKGGTFRHRPYIRQSKNQPVQPCVKQGIPIT